MRCENCKKKGIPLQCKFCNKGFCCSCIQLEVHNCEGLKVKIDKDIKRLEKDITCTPKKKLEAI